MFTLRAPYPSLQVTLVLPSPKFSDSVGLTSTMQISRAMDGTSYTYVKSRGGRKRLQWDFTVARNKALELRVFINAYYRLPIQVIDHDSNIWIGYLVNNPFESTGSGRAVRFPGGEVMDLTLEFEERE
ncbi:MAG: hypothetical protein AMS22_07535 [Thiotrichales bacterium SG8_50]|nr:MAG: hypothetical protein AMS22_07535 [Thiotrichales bacterium SG8_50]